MGVSQELTLDQFAAWAAGRGRELQALDWRPAWKRVGVLLAGETKRNFDQAQAPDGTPWAGLKTRAGQPLRDRGLLMASATANGPGHVEEATPTTFAWGTNHEHAATHQWGATVRPKGARLLAVPLTPEARRHDGPRQFPRELALVSRKGRPPLLVENVPGRRARSVFHYVLVPQVVIPARPFVGVNDRVADGVNAIAADFVEERLGGQ